MKMNVPRHFLPGRRGILTTWPTTMTNKDHGKHHDHWNATSPEA